MMYCAKCGAQSTENSAFCARCGAPLMNSVPPSPQQPPAGGQGYYQPQPQGYAPPPQGYAPPPPQGYAPPPQGYNRVPQPGFYAPQSYGQAQAMTAPRKSKSALIAVVAVAAVVVLAIAGFFVFRGAGNPLLGTWTNSDSGYDITITFKRGGVVEGEFGGDPKSSSYKVKGDVLTITDGDGSVYEYTYDITKESGETALSIYGGNTDTLYKI